MNIFDVELVVIIKFLFVNEGVDKDDVFLIIFVEFMKECVIVYGDFWENGQYFFCDIEQYDEKNVWKKWKLENQLFFEIFCD